MNVGASLLFILSAIHDIISNIPSVFLTLNRRSYEIEDDISVNLTNVIFLACSIGGSAWLGGGADARTIGEEKGVAWGGVAVVPIASPFCRAITMLGGM